MSDKFNNFFKKLNEDNNISSVISSKFQDLQKDIKEASNHLEAKLSQNENQSEENDAKPNPKQSGPGRPRAGTNESTGAGTGSVAPSPLDSGDSSNKKIYVNEIYFNNLITQNEQLSNKINSQEDDFNLQYQTFQQELSHLGERICVLEAERKELFSENTSLKHLLASKKEGEKNKKEANDDSKENDESVEEDNDNDEAIKNEFDNEIKRLRSHNTEQQRIISKLMKDKMVSESENFSKIERLTNLNEQKEKIINQHQDLTEELFKCREEFKKVNQDRDELSIEIGQIKMKNHELEELSSERKETLNSLAIDAQKQLQGKNDEINEQVKEIEKLKKEISTIKSEVLDLNKTISLSQKQDYHKSREIDRITEKSQSKDKEIKGLYEQKEILENDLRNEQKKFEESEKSNKEFIESIRFNLEGKLSSLENQLNESLEHNKRITLDIAKRDDMIQELKETTIPINVSSVSSSQSQHTNPKVLVTTSTSQNNSEALRKNKELKEAIQRALTAEKKMVILKKDLSKQLSMEKRRCKTLSDKLAGLESHKPDVGRATSTSGHSHLGVTFSNASNNNTCRSISGSTTGSQHSNQGHASSNSKFENLEDELKLKIKQLEKDLETALSGAASSTRNRSSSSASSLPVEAVGVDYRAINQQLSSLLEDEMMKNKALRDNIVDLTEQLAGVGI